MAKLSDVENSLVPKYLQEYDLGQECMQGVVTHIANRKRMDYIPFPSISRILQGVLSSQKNFQALHTDILLVTTPKAGTTWHVLGYWKESLKRQEKVMFLKYEEMKKKPDFYLKELAEFLECPFSKEEESKGVVDDILNLCSFEKLSNLEVNKTGKVSFGMENKYFFRLGQVGDCKNVLTTEMIEQLNTITESKLAEHGLRF